jgi:hypothetical protein
VCRLCHADTGLHPELAALPDDFGKPASEGHTVGDIGIGWFGGYGDRPQPRATVDQFHRIHVSHFALTFNRALAAQGVLSFSGGEVAWACDRRSPARSTAPLLALRPLLLPDLPPAVLRVSAPELHRHALTA